MICTECGYEIPYEHMKETGISKVHCRACGTSNETSDDFQCSDCNGSIDREVVKQYNGKNVPCPDCKSKNSFNLHPSAQFNVVPSVYDLLENPETAMVPSIREEQVTVANNIQDALWTEESCIAEAGTGTGKTLAYLVPALSMGKRVIVSTATKALQDQIMKEDGPWVLDKLRDMGIQRNIAIKKGKGNFACVHDFLNIKDELLDKYRSKNDEYRQKEVHRFQSWLDEAEEGEHDADLNEYSDPPDWVNRVRVDECAKSKCSKCQICGYYRNRGKVEMADVVVANHDLVAIEYMVPAQLGEAGKNLKDFIFGDRQALIFDEAHQLQERFENVWTEEIKTTSVHNTLNRMDSLIPDGPQPQSVDERVYTVNFRSGEDEEGERTAEEFSINVGAVHEGMEEVGSFDPETAKNLKKRLYSLGSDLAFNPGKSEDTVVLDAETSQKHRKTLGKIYASMCHLMKGIRKYFIYLESEAEDPSRRSHEEVIEELRKIKPVYRSIDKWITLMESWLDMRSDYVYYVKKFQLNSGQTAYSMIRQPVNMANVLQDFWKQNPSCIFSSATMSNQVQGKPSFNLFQSRLGTQVPEDNCISIKSPFNFKKRCATYVTRDKSLRPPKYNDSKPKKERYYNRLASEIEHWVNLTRGNALVLFASANDLQEVYQRVSLTYPVHAQMRGKVPPNVAKSRYIKDAKKMCKRTPREGPVLFGLKSFWEGVSFKGPYLLNVIVTRIPFPNPSNPLIEERQKRLGKHSFPVLYQYPASIAARQGTGRLLRTMKDAGIVALLDERISSKRWGASILRELDVATNKFFKKDSMEKAWNHVDNYINKMLEKTDL